MRWRAVGVLLIVAAFLHVDARADIVIPTNDSGINWKTLKPCKKKVKLASGEEVEQQITWDPYGEGQRGTAYGYEVELNKEVTVGTVTKKKIKVWVFPKDPPEGVGADLWARFIYWCHGLTFNDNIYSPGGEEIPFVLAAGWEAYDWREKMKRGDIIVYYDVNGNVVHSAVSNGDGTFDSKNAYEPRVPRATKDELDRQYSAETRHTAKCFRRKP